MKCYATIVTSYSYMAGVKALKISLEETKTGYPLMIFMPEKLYSVIKPNEWGISKDDIIVYSSSVIIPANIIAATAETKNAQWVNTFDKLLLFDQTQYEKIVFLDCDMMIRQNIDNLFLCRHMSAVKASVGDECYSRGFNSGVMVIEPRKGLAEKIMGEVDWNALSRKYTAISDNDILTEYYIEWNADEELHLNDSYNYIFPFFKMYQDIGIYIDDAKVIHFAGRIKPWEWDENMRKVFCDNEYLDDFFKKYMQYIGKAV